MSDFFLRFDYATGRNPEQRPVILDANGVPYFFESEEEGPAAYLMVNEDLERFLEFARALPGSLAIRDYGTQRRKGQTTPLRQTFSYARTPYVAVRSKYGQTGRLLQGVAQLFAGAPVAEVRFYFIGVPRDQWTDLVRKQEGRCVPRSTLEIRRRFVGRSAAAEEVRRLVLLLADQLATVLVTGPTGSGKDVVARLLHHFSGRTGPFHPLNCAAIPAPLFEDELFGRDQGAFTGATVARKGAFELARGGTLFLDEIGELPMELQAKLLRALEERAVQRLGGVGYRKFDARVIVATNRNLAEMVEQGTFREDLYYRLCTFPIFTPPLASEDVEALAHHAWRKFEKNADLPLEVLGALCARRWAGNVRQLERALERLALESHGGVATPDLLARILFEQEHGRPAALSANPESESQYIKRLREVTSEFRELRDDYVAAGHALETFLRGRTSVHSPGSEIYRCTRSVAELAEELQRDWSGRSVAEIPDLCRIRVVVESRRAVQELVRDLACSLKLEPWRDPSLGEADPPEARGDAEGVEEQGVLRDLEFGPTRCRVRVGDTPLDMLGAEFSRLSETSRNLWVDVDFRTVFEDQWEAVCGDGHAAALPEGCTEDLRLLRRALGDVQAALDRIRAARRAEESRPEPFRSGPEMRRELKILERALVCAPEDPELAVRAATVAGLLGNVDTAVLLVKQFPREFQVKVLTEIGRKICDRYPESSEAHGRGLELQKAAFDLAGPSDDDMTSHYAMFPTAATDIPMLLGPQDELDWLRVPKNDA